MSHQVNAGSSILTWVRLTLIDLSLADVPLITRHTLQEKHVSTTYVLIYLQFFIFYS